MKTVTPLFIAGMKKKKRKKQNEKLKGKDDRHENFK